MYKISCSTHNSKKNLSDSTLAMTNLLEILSNLIAAKQIYSSTNSCSKIVFQETKLSLALIIW